MAYRFAEIASNGTRIVGDYEDSSTPPEVFLYTAGQTSVSIIDKLDPEFDHLTIGRTEPFTWKTSNGYEVTGRLLLPPGYIQGDKYPLVIQTKTDDGWFVCDSGSNHDPSFAPQPIANANILYLIRSYPEHWSEHDEVAHYPKDYPGQVGEAAFQTDIWDSAVDALDKRGMIDRDRVGIIGFSRSGWYTEFGIAHGRTHYRAATAADNVKYSLGEYWMSRDTDSMKTYDLMYGGPPYGTSLKNWMDYSISFNLEKIHTPLLIEVMGYGTPFDDWLRPPENLATNFEIVSGLMRLKAPVELYYYPNEEHQPEHPQARLATLQRNLDWYRFWLQDYERSHPDDPDQYVRWRSLRALQLERPEPSKD
jgi:dipeptidyl aminopeptidase/acylaminoacyl peptidase